MRSNLSNLDSSSSPGKLANVTANGIARQVPVPCSLVQFLESQGLRPQNVVVEYNGAALAHSEFIKIHVSDGDRLEIVRIVAGG